MTLRTVLQFLKGKNVFGPGAAWNEGLASAALFGLWFLYAWFMPYYPRMLLKEIPLVLGIAFGIGFALSGIRFGHEHVRFLSVVMMLAWNGFLAFTFPRSSRS